LEENSKDKESNFMKICPVGAELFHVDGQREKQTDKQI
jgi:hypothetical protein